MGNFVIQFADSRKTLKIFKVTSASKQLFIMDYKFESTEDAEVVAKDLVSKSKEGFTAKII